NQRNHVGTNVQITRGRQRRFVQKRFDRRRRAEREQHGCIKSAIEHDDSRLVGCDAPFSVGEQVRGEIAERVDGPRPVGFQGCADRGEVTGRWHKVCDFWSWQVYPTRRKTATIAKTQQEVSMLQRRLRSLVATDRKPPSPPSADRLAARP